MSGKRANIFGQGRPENPYDDRDSSEPDVPVRATAAQLAQRKIKVAKGRRPAGASPAGTPSPSFAAPQSSGFNFGGASAPASNGVNFGASNNTFGGSVNNSFPPAQSAAPSDSFTNSSFPAFGASTQTTGFNFTSNSNSVPNPFGQLNGASPAASMAPAPAFGASSAFTSQPSNNTFGAFSQNSNTSAAPASSLFGSTSAPNTSAPATAPFSFSPSGTAAQDNTSTPASASSLFGFPATTATSQNNTSAPATSTAFGFGAPTPATTGQSQPAVFGGFTSNEQQQATTTSTTQPNLFGASTSAPAFAPSTSLFNFSAGSTNTATSSAASSSAIFSSMDPNTPQASPFPKTFTTQPSKPSPVPAPAFGGFGQQAKQGEQQAQANPFAGFKFTDPSADAPKPTLFSSVSAPQPQPAFSAPETSQPALFSSVSAPQQQPTFSAPETPKPSLFSSSQASQQESTPAASETPKPNLFSSLAKAQQPAADSSMLKFGTQNEAAAPAASDKPSESTAFQAPKAGSFSLFSTPQPAKTAEAEKPQVGLFSAQPKPSSGIFSQTFQSGNSNTFKAGPSFTSSMPQTAEVSKEAPAKPIASTGSTNLFAKAQPSAPSSTSFASTKENAPTPSASPMPTLTGGTSATSGTAAPELPRIPKAHVPKEWSTAANTINSDDESQDLVVSLAVQLQQLNESYRAKLSNLSPLADWSALSLWHHQQSSAIKKQIDMAKKGRAQAKGITGNESSLSTKRKVQDRDPEDQHASPTKRSRPADTDASPTPQASMSASPTPTATSNLFAKALGPQRSAAPESTSLFTPKTTSGSATEAPKFNAPNAGFKPAVPGAVGQGAASPFSPFKPTTSTAPSSAAGGFKPTSAGGSSGGFASQFAAKAKTYEELRAERKKKAKDEDYDSDDETEEQWSARWDKEEDARLAKEKAEVASASGFSMPSSAKTSGASTPATNLFSGLPKPAAATSSSANGLFNSRPVSPALSTGSQSVFDAPSTSHAASPNIFGHLSSGPSSSNQDHSSDEEESAPAVAPPTTPPKRKTDNLANETDEEASKSKTKEVAPKGSLLSRMTKSTDDGSESEKENGTSGSIFGSTNGTTTPKPFAYFNFEAAGTKTAPPKSDTFGGDQTFKMGTPIKFGGAPATEKKADTAAPTFSFQPASTSTTPSKPPPSSFNFGSATSGSSLLPPGGGFSGFNSAPSSTFSSRAATPLSEADTSAQSAAEDEEEKQEQVDLSQLTDEELKSNDIVFETPIALAKHLVDKGDGTKTWEIFAKGPLWILKDKVTGKCFVRVRIASGATPLNYNILPALKAQSKGSGGKSVQVTMPKKEGGFAQIFIFFRNSDFAEEFTTKYNESLPA